MDDVLLMYRACGAECREDWLRFLADENAMPLAEVQRAADGFGPAGEFDALVDFCESRGARLQ